MNSTDPKSNSVPETSEGLLVTEETRDSLGKSSPWMKFLGIVGYVSIDLMVVVGLGLIVFSGVESVHRFGILFPVLGLVYLALSGEFPAYGKIYYRNYNDHVYSYDRHSPGLISVTM